MDKLGKVPPASEITPEPLYLRRREFIRNALLFTVTSTGVGGSLLWLINGNRANEPTSSSVSASVPSLTVASRSSYSTDELPTPYRDVTTYNNFYEFGLDKSDPAANAHTLKRRPWTVRIEGEVRKPLVIDIEQLLTWFPLEERIYRMRCVEAWSMVIPWLGFPLADLIKRVEPTSRAKAEVFLTMKTAVRKTPPHPWLKPAVFVGSLTPVVAILTRVLRGELGANPISQALNQLGLIALVFLVAALACTPLKTFFGWTWPIRLRRILGLYGFFYATLHVSTYAGIDQFFDWHAIFADVTKRKFIFVGFAAFVFLIPLAVTSTNQAVKRMGYARWKQLHRLAYVAPMLGVIHFTWRVKKDVSEPTLYAIILGALLLIRVVAYVRSRLSASATA
jgi:sulfoxide reductase heme-binding subunit YedZ